MKSIIKQLDSVTINKIAAGEVIDRPASIVKELIENALDAKATQITIHIEDGGKELIKITDNGTGFHKEDLPLAPLRHATSKITSIDDVYNTHSFGFRGEALASVCHCAFLTITSAQLDKPAYCITAHQDKISAIQSATHPTGTTIAVENLFHNIPVRQRFLKSAATELTYIIEVCMHFSLIHPAVDFRLIANNQEKLNTTGIQSTYPLLIQLYGKELKNNCININETIGPVTFKGYVSNPTLTFSNRSKQVIAINNRLVKNALITKALADSFKDLIPQRRFPMVVLNIHVNQSLIDINIHPQKHDIKFINPGFLFDSLPKAIRIALQQQHTHTDPVSTELQPAQAPTPPTSIAPSSPTEFQELAAATKSEQKILKPYRILDNDSPKRPVADYQTSSLAAFGHTTPPLSNTSNPNSVSPTTQPTQAKLAINDTAPPELDFLQVFDTYIILKTAAGAYVIDQHAVHERILYEKFKRNIQHEKSRQPLLLSETLTLSIDQMTLFEEYQHYFEELNFCVEPFGPNQIAIREIPVTFQQASVGDLVLSILEQLKAFPGSQRNLSLDQKAMLERKACRAAIKAGQKLHEKEVRQLLIDFIKSPQNYTCPHGRPLYILLDQHRLETMFLRK